MVSHAGEVLINQHMRHGGSDWGQACVLPILVLFCKDESGFERTELSHVFIEIWT